MLRSTVPSFNMNAEYLFSNINDLNKIHTLILEKPVLIPSLSWLSTSCLRVFRDLFEDELEPIKISDLLFEERAVDIFHHDRITEIESRRNQIKILLETLNENKEDSFHFFLYILQNEFKTICIELKQTPFAAPRVSVFDGTRSLTYEVARAQGSNLSIYYFVWTFVFFLYINYLKLNTW